MSLHRLAAQQQAEEWEQEGDSTLMRLRRTRESTVTMKQRNVARLLGMPPL
jgi:hypothetical protein